MSINKENYREEIEEQIKKYNLKIEKLPPGIAIGAIETFVDKYANRVRRIPPCVDKRTIKI